MSHPTSSTVVAQPAAPASASLSIFILALAGFLVVTTEFLIVGLLPALSRDLGISISMAGQLVTLFAFTVMLFGPPLTAWLSHLDRKALFIAVLLVFALSNALAAVATNIWVLALARFIPALALPVFWGTASETAAELAGPGKAGQAVAKVYLGISAALLFGIPLGTIAANSIGWRSAFWILAALSLAIALALWRLMPAVARARRVDFRSQARLFREPFFLANVALSILAFTAMFTAYTYLADILERIAGVAPANVGWWLMGFGAIGLIGNWLGGKAVDRAPLRATAIFAGLLALGMALCVPAAGNPVLFCAVLALWGIAYTGLFPICQVRVMKAATHSQALAGTANVSAANAGIGIGAMLGGVVIPWLGLEMVGYVAAGFALAAALLAPLVARLRRADRP
ncbi:MFS transporter [Massilia oculi]|uniref:MFS transporter n=1 Tax=Massilia oculi TaxID=945844 RepID=A0A2S2DGA7_9BURK|nr:MFS transporter [Massilia oculi]AWL04119.1 MFS transporter [Massilia oculi]